MVVPTSSVVVCRAGCASIATVAVRMAVTVSSNAVGEDVVHDQKEQEHPAANHVRPGIVHNALLIRLQHLFGEAPCNSPVGIRIGVVVVKVSIRICCS